MGQFLCETEKYNTQGFTVILYVKGTSERIGSFLKKHNIHTVFKPNKKLGQVMRSVKDEVDLKDRVGVKRITCEREKVYLDQTRKSIKE